MKQIQTNILNSNQCKRQGFRLRAIYPPRTWEGRPQRSQKACTHFLGHRHHQVSYPPGYPATTPTESGPQMSDGRSDAS